MSGGTRRQKRNHGPRAHSGVGVLYPHEVCAAIFASNTDAFNHIFVGSEGPDGLKGFWDAQKDMKWVKEHPGFLQVRADPKLP